MPTDEPLRRDSRAIARRRASDDASHLLIENNPFGVYY